MSIQVQTEAIQKVFIQMAGYFAFAGLGYSAASCRY